MKTTLILLALVLGACTTNPVSEPVSEPASDPVSAPQEAPIAADTAPQEAPAEAPNEAPDPDGPSPEIPVDTGRTPMDAVLQALALDLGERVAVEGKAKEDGDWAFFTGKIPTKPGGSAIDWSKTRHGAAPEGADNATVALLQRNGEVWAVVEIDLLCNDVCWEQYPTRHPDAPASLFK
jgi:hypothetical protein